MTRFWILSLMVLGAIATQAQAGHHCGCPSCGCTQVKKVCKMVEDHRKITTFRYCYECEDFCLPGPSCVCCKQKVCDCYCGSKYISWKKVFSKPKYCECPRTRKLLTKVPVTTEQKFWTCKVERVCCACGCAALDEKATIEARAKQILPASAEEPIVLDEHSDFNVEPATGALDLEQPADMIPANAKAEVAADEATEEKAEDKTAEKKSWFSRLFGG